MTKTIFITGTDTGIGKTYISCLLLKTYETSGLKTFAAKPIASGCYKDRNGKLISEDALCLQQHSTIKKPYSIVNPIAFEKPIAPHIAAKEVNFALTKSLVSNKIVSSIQKNADINLIEGMGGWSVPLNDHELFSDVIVDLHIPVILVVGIRLGCLNHALLTYQNMLTRNVPVLGWIANCLDPLSLSMEENIFSLKKWIDAPCLAMVPYGCETLNICLNLINMS